MYRTSFVKLKFWKLLSNSKATFDPENVNLLKNPNVKHKNPVAYKKRVLRNITWDDFYKEAVKICSERMRFISRNHSSTFVLVNLQRNKNFCKEIYISPRAICSVIAMSL